MSEYGSEDEAIQDDVLDDSSTTPTVFDDDGIFQPSATGGANGAYGGSSKIIRTASTFSDTYAEDKVAAMGYQRPEHKVDPGQPFDFMLVDVEMMYGLLEHPSLDDPTVLHHSVIDPPVDIGEDDDEDDDDDDMPGPNGKRRFRPNKKKRPNQIPVSVPIIRIYGVTNEGSSVVVDAYGYYPAFRLRITNGFSDEIDKETFLFRLCKRLEIVLLPPPTNGRPKELTHNRPRQIVSARFVDGFPAFPYCEKPCQFIEFRLANPRHVRTLSTYFTNNPALQYSNPDVIFQFLPYTGEDPLIQFMVEADLKGFGWVRLDNYMVPGYGAAFALNGYRAATTAGFKFKYMAEELDRDGPSQYGLNMASRLEAINTTTCSARYVANWKNSLHPMNDVDSIAPLRVLSVDIECLKDAGIPDPQRNSVIVIGAITSTSKDALFEDISSVKSNLMMALHPRVGADSPLRMLFETATLDALNIFKTIYNYGSEDRKLVFSWSMGTEIDTGHGIKDQYMYNNEMDMMIAFGAFVKTYDPDVIVGHNIVGFDIPYLLIRANKIGIDICSELGRRSLTASAGKWVPPKEITRVRKNGEVRKNLRGETPGRIQLDTLPFVQGQTKESSYKLGALASKYLGDTKDDVGYNMIAPLFKESAETRRRLRLYCVKDVELSLGLVKHRRFNMLMSTVALARETKVPAYRLLRSGAQEKVRTLILHQASRPNFEATCMIPVFFPYEIPVSREKDNKFKGATVLPPTRGYSSPDKPVATGDYKSLYPSTMISNNICYTTEIISKEEIARLPHNTSPTDIKFVTREHRKGILPQVLEALLGARDNAKKQLKATKDPAMKRYYDNKQLQLKIVANSCYGALTASGGWFVRMELGESVTSWGRAAIDRARAIAMGPPFNAKVLYGDTDSIMMQFPGVTTVEAAFDKLDAVCKAVSATFPPPMELQAEKVYSPHLQLGKKRYVGMCHIKGEKPKIDSKGVEKNRLDNCPLVRKTMETVFKLLFEKVDLKAALAYVRQVAEDLIQGRVEISDLVITKSISKDNYASKMIHVEVANRMCKRDPSYLAAPGERIPYVIVCANETEKLFGRGEDPLWCITHNIPIDIDYYIAKQLAGPLARIFMWYIGDPSIIASIHTLEDRLYRHMTDAELRRVQGRVNALKMKSINGGGDLTDVEILELNDMSTRLKMRISDKDFDDTSSKIDKLVKKLTESVAEKLLGKSALMGIHRPRTQKISGDIIKYFQVIPQAPTQAQQDLESEEEKKLCKMMDLEEQLRVYKNICATCRGYEDTTGKVQCQQRDCTNLFRLAKTTRDIEDLK